MNRPTPALFVKKIIRESTGKRVGQDAIFCDGSCRTWLHRCCAGLSKTRFEEMQSSEAAFLCPACDMDSQQDALQQMKDGQQEALQLLKEEIGMLHAEVKQLKDSLSISQSMLSSFGRKAKSTRTRSRKQVSQEPVYTSTQENVKQHYQSSSSTTTQRQQKQCTRVAIQGARRIWGTRKSTSTTHVANQLKELTSNDVSKLAIKRKFKSDSSNSSRVNKWWFIIRGEEDLLIQLEGSWTAVLMQTSWKLEPAYSYLDSTSNQVHSEEDVTLSQNRSSGQEYNNEGINFPLNVPSSNGPSALNTSTINGESTANTHDSTPLINDSQFFF